MEEPRLEQFGLNKEQYDYLKKNDFKAHNIIMIIGVVIAILIANYILFSNPDNIGIPIVRLIARWFLICIVVGGANGLVLGLIISLIHRGIRNRYPGNYRKLNLYEAAKQKYHSWWVRNQKMFWTSLSGKRFEHELAFLYSKLGYEVEFPKRGEPDRGIDIVLKKGGKTIIVQCKAHKKPVGPHIVRDLHGTLIKAKADEAILASISGFTSGVIEYTCGLPINLISLEEILLMRKKISSD
jgi:hypothetical protein